MTASNFPNVLPVTLAYEGGKSTIKSDPGNWTGGKVGKGVLKGTNKGIAASAHPTLDIMNLTDDDVSRIYETEYWKPSGAYLQPNGLDLSVFDCSVNSGNGRGKAILAKVGSGTTFEKIQRYADARLAFLQGLGTFKTFGKGWSTRIAGVEAKSIRMAAGNDTALAKSTLTKAAGVQKTKARNKRSAVSVAGPGAFVSTAATGAHTWIIVATVGCIIVGCVVAAVLASRNETRSTALLAEAAK